MCVGQANAWAACCALRISTADVSSISALVHVTGRTPNTVIHSTSIRPHAVDTLNSVLDWNRP